MAPFLVTWKCSGCLYTSILVWLRNVLLKRESQMPSLAVVVQVTESSWPAQTRFLFNRTKPGVLQRKAHCTNRPRVQHEITENALKCTQTRPRVLSTSCFTPSCSFRAARLKQTQPQNAIAEHLAVQRESLKLIADGMYDFGVVQLLFAVNSLIQQKHPFLLRGNPGISSLKLNFLLEGWS